MTLQNALNDSISNIEMALKSKEQDIIRALHDVIDFANWHISNVSKGKVLNTLDAGVPEVLARDVSTYRELELKVHLLYSIKDRATK